MKGVLVDSNIILDIFEDDPRWADWSEDVLNKYGETHILYINQIVYSEVSIGFKNIEQLEQALNSAGFQMLIIPKKPFSSPEKYLSNTGSKRGPKPRPCLIF